MKKTKTAFLESDLLKYYMSITVKPKLCIEAHSVENRVFHLNMANLILLFAYERYELTQWIDLNVLILPKGSSCDTDEVRVEYKSTILLEKRKLFQLNSCSLLAELGAGESLPDIESCKRPSVMVPEKRLIISGLSSTLRFILRYCSIVAKKEKGNVDQNENGREVLRREMEVLLGFRSGCLQACAEASIWTKFCEVDMTERMILALVKAVNSSVEPNYDWELPQDLLRFEYHLREPVRIHNLGKRAQEQEKLIELNGKREIPGHVIPPSTPTNNDIGRGSTSQNISQFQQLSHDYAEGPDITISDLMIFPCVDLAKRLFGDVFETYLPNVLAWYHRLEVTFKDTPLQIQLLNKMVPIIRPEPLRVLVVQVPQESLYKSDSSRDKLKMRYFTKQNQIQAALEVLQTGGMLEPMEAGLGPEMRELMEPLVDWMGLPPLVRPEGVPESRREKKCDQLANLLQMVMFIYKQRRSGDDGHSEPPHSEPPLKIVDFCAGGGHVGILVAWILPHCHVILVENKEESVRRAQERVEKLKLSNISVFQCNLNSFDGHFDIGVALHACGTATDSVLEKCVRARASFVVCPCCYGAIQSNHVLHYPRSSSFQGLTLSQYLVLCHAADQTQEDKGNEKTSQGRFCMRIIDTDRLYYLSHKGYQTWLGRITPESASPKNHILLGIHR